MTAITGNIAQAMESFLRGQFNSCNMYLAPIYALGEQ